MSADWDAATYDRIADPMAAWGSTVLDRLPLAGDETVLDAGCGSGRVTEALLARLPRGAVIALDASESMLDEARRRLAPADGRVSFVRADLAQPLPLVEPVDAILSTATFHWVRDHDRLFANLARVLRPGGRLAAQCGGAGNIASVLAAVERLGAGGAEHRTFATAERTRQRLEAAGFVEVRAWLHPEPVTLESRDALATYLRTIVLRPTLADIPPDGHDAFVSAVVDGMPSLTLDYVRLDIDARLPAAR